MLGTITYIHPEPNIPQKTIPPTPRTPVIPVATSATPEHPHPWAASLAQPQRCGMACCSGVVVGAGAIGGTSVVVRDVEVVAESGSGACVGVSWAACGGRVEGAVVEGPSSSAGDGWCCCVCAVVVGMSRAETWTRWDCERRRSARAAVREVFERGGEVSGFGT